jgi:hypothetical protein
MAHRAWEGDRSFGSLVCLGGNHASGTGWLVRLGRRSWRTLTKLSTCARLAVGTAFHINEKEVLADGRTVLRCIGSWRFRVKGHWIEPGTQGLQYAIVERLEDDLDWMCDQAHVDSWRQLLEEFLDRVRVVRGGGGAFGHLMRSPADAADEGRRVLRPHAARLGNQRRWCIPYVVLACRGAPPGATAQAEAAGDELVIGKAAGVLHCPRARCWCVRCLPSDLPLK